MPGASLLNRGRVCGSLLILLGAWGGIVPFVGPYFGYAYTPDKTWQYTSGRLWLSVLPGAVVFLGGLMILIFDTLAIPGALLAALGGVWFVIGIPVTAVAIHTSAVSPGSPVVSSGALFGGATMKFLEGLGFFYGLGVVVLFLAAFALGEVLATRVAGNVHRERMEEAMEERTGEFGAAY